MISPPRRMSGRLMINLAAILGILVLSFLAGAIVVYFGLPTSTFLYRAFRGGEEFFKGSSSIGSGLGAPTVSKDEKGETFDGFTLYTSEAAPRAALIDMRGNIVHEWKKSYRDLWPVTGSQLEESESNAWFTDCHLYPDGSLLAVFDGPKGPPGMYGLVKLDRKGNRIWDYHEIAHDGIDVDEDGNIYALVEKSADKAPPGLEKDPPSGPLDCLVVLNEDGKEVNSLSIVAAFRQSPYAALLGPAEVRTDKRGEVIRASFVEVLTKKRAEKFAERVPSVKPGQVLISISLPAQHETDRSTVDAIAILDVKTRSVVWAAHGPWRAQQECHCLDDGRLLIFDSVGSLKAPRVLEYDPKDQSVPWSYSVEGSTSERDSGKLRVPAGGCQRLPNGNTLVLLSRGGVLQEITESKEVVWQCRTGGRVPMARRYAPDQVKEFLDGGQRARPE